MGCSPWGHKESDMTERLSTAQHIVGINKLQRFPGVSPSPPGLSSGFIWPHMPIFYETEENFFSAPILSLPETLCYTKDTVQRKCKNYYKPFSVSNI